MINFLIIVRAYGAPAIATLCIYWGQRLGLADEFLAKHPSLFLNSWRQIILCWSALALGLVIIRPSLTSVWNRLTPIKDRSTLIENEIIFMLSTTIGTALVLTVFRVVAISDLLTLSLWVFLATIPAMLFAYGTHMWIKKLADRATPIIDAKPREKHIIPEREEPNFWRRRLAFPVAALVFNIVFEIILFAIVFIKTGQIYSPSRFDLYCLAGSLVTLSLFGSQLLKLGHKVLTKIRAPVMSERKREAIAYTTSIVLFFAFFISLSLVPGIKQPNQPDVLGWAGLLASVAITLCAICAGTVLAYMRIPKIKPI